MRTDFMVETEKIRRFHDGNLEKNEIMIKKLKKENEDLKKKLTKVNNIIAKWFNWII